MVKSKKKIKRQRSVFWMVFFILVVLALIAGIIQFAVCVVGSQNVVSQTRGSDEFNKVVLKGSGNIYVTQSGAPEIRIEAEDNIIPLIRTSIVDSELTIDPEPFKCFRNRKPIDIYLSMKDVKQVSISGSGKIVSQNKIVSDKIELKVSGSGNIDMNVDTNELITTIAGSSNTVYRGDAKSHTVIISGSGDMKAYDLETEKTSITISGSGKTEVSASKELDIEISGSGSVFYRGNPSTVNQEIAGSGSVKKAG